MPEQQSPLRMPTRRLGLGPAPAPLSPAEGAAAFSNQEETPYLDALEAFAAADVARLHVPGHKGGAGASERMREAIGEQALRLDIPAVTDGIDIGARPTPLQRAETLAADLWGAKRTWFLTGGASQGNLAISVALAAHSSRVVVQRNVHSSTVSGLVVSGLRPTFVAPEVDADLPIAHCLSPAALDRALHETPDAGAAIVVSPTYYGAVADVRALVEVAHSHGVPLVVDEAWGAHLNLHEALPDQALACGADLVIQGTHKIVGSMSQSAMLHLGWGSDRLLDEDLLERSLSLFSTTSPSSLLRASLDAARAHAALNGHALLEDTVQAIGLTRQALERLPGIAVLDESIVGRPGVWDYDPLRMVIDVRGTGASGFDLAERMRERSCVYLEFVEEDVMVSLFGLGGSAQNEGTRLVDALRSAIGRLDPVASPGLRQRPVSPAQWGPLEMAPRDAFLAAHETLPIEAAVGRVAAESLAVYPPGIANVLPGERFQASTLRYVRRISEHGGRVRGASDPTLRTVRVVSDR